MLVAFVAEISSAPEGGRRSSVEVDQGVQSFPHDLYHFILLTATMASSSNGSTPQKIAIVGGGIMGVCTAYYLTRQPEFEHGKVTVHLIEENEEIASGASGMAAGFLAKDWHSRATEVGR